jgi:hypothetical protein
MNVKIIQIVVDKVYQPDVRDRMLQNISNESWAAVRQVLLEDIEQNTAIATHEDTVKQPEVAKYYVGRVAGIRDLLANLEVCRQFGKEISRL